VAGAAGNFWSVHRAGGYAVTAPRSARLRPRVSHSAGPDVNTKPHQKGGTITAITSALTALARPPA